MKTLLGEAADRAIRFLETMDDRGVAPSTGALERLTELGGPLSDQPTNPLTVLRLLDEIGSPATMLSPGGRYFGFVIGGSLPVTVAANWLATAWDQNAAFVITSPVAAALEEISLRWLLEIFNLPANSGGAFVTGATMANFTALAAARHEVLRDAGWDVQSQGMTGAPQVNVIVGAEAHPTLLQVLSLLGFGRDRVTTVPTDGQGRMRADSLPELSKPSIICIQAGNVNTGAFDPANEICDLAKSAGAWVHVDGAFGLWAAAAPERAHLVDGFSRADSWATDAHKWLNVPYDCGVAFVRNPDPLVATMSLTASYLIQGAPREPSQYSPELSRRARGKRSGLH